MREALLVLISCTDKPQAEQLGDMLLKQKLAACVQIIPQVDSLYLWPPGKNQIDYASETVLLVKTLQNKWHGIETAVLAHHSYQNPEIIGIPMTHVAKNYLRWLETELGEVIN